MKKRQLMLLLGSMGAGPVLGADAETPLSIPIAAHAPEHAAVVELDTADRLGVYSDTGDFLREVPGVSGIRFGGYGIDPVIRGQSMNRINVLLDGAYVFGGCPNRMDPPTSYAPLDSYERITVIKGSQTVRYGAGGSGGTVLLERDTPRFAEGEGPRVRIGGGYGSNADSVETSADVAAGGTGGFARAIVGYKEAENYEDGDGREVRSAYQESSGSVILGYTPDAVSRWELGLDGVRTEDTLYIGNMDSPESQSDTVRLKYAASAGEGLFDAVDAQVYYSDVYHVMDNFSFRTPTMPMEVPSDSVTRGGRFSGEVHGAGRRWTLGVDYQGNRREAVRSIETAAGWQSESLLWPDADIVQSGLFAELEQDLGPWSRLAGGLRYDRVDATAARAAETPEASGRLAADALYQMYYGTTAGDRNEDNLGGFLRYERDLSRPRLTWSLGVSRSVRTADATERFVAGNAMMMDPSTRWVGNPGLDPEVHRQIELGLVGQGDRWSGSASVYYNDVQDYILRDRAAGQDGVLLADGAAIYRNVDAELYGAEAQASWRWSPVWVSRASLAWVRATNTEDDRPLPRIPALEGSLGLEYLAAAWAAGTRLRLVDDQDRVDTASGLDLGPTPGYGVLDLYARYRWGERGELGAGVDNVLDRAYAEHLTRDAAFDPTVYRVNEPGRNIWLKASVRF